MINMRIGLQISLLSANDIGNLPAYEMKDKPRPGPSKSPSSNPGLAGAPIPPPLAVPKTPRGFELRFGSNVPSAPRPCFSCGKIDEEIRWSRLAVATVCFSFSKASARCCEKGCCCCLPWKSPRDRSDESGGVPTENEVEVALALPGDVARRPSRGESGENDLEIVPRPTGLVVVELDLLGERDPTAARLANPGVDDGCELKMFGEDHPVVAVGSSVEEVVGAVCDNATTASSRTGAIATSTASCAEMRCDEANSTSNSGTTGGSVYRS